TEEGVAHDEKGPPVPQDLEGLTDPTIHVGETLPPHGASVARGQWLLQATKSHTGESHGRTDRRGFPRQQLRLEVDRLHPVRVQLRHRSAARWPGREAPGARARRRRTSDLAGIRLREAAPARLLPERSPPAHETAPPAQRRQLRGDRLGHGDPRGCGALRSHPRHPRRGVDLLLPPWGAEGPTPPRARPPPAPGAPPPTPPP